VRHAVECCVVAVSSYEWLPANSDVEADVALSRCAPTGPRSLTPVVMRTAGTAWTGGHHATVNYFVQSPGALGTFRT
jgi:hypothetical protein